MGVARLGHSRLIHRTGDAEINQISEIVAIEQDLGGFDVAVEQTNLVGSMHSFLIRGLLRRSSGNKLQNP
jgi:hypothetical protein